MKKIYLSLVIVLLTLATYTLTIAATGFNFEGASEFDRNQKIIEIINTDLSGNEDKAYTYSDIATGNVMDKLHASAHESKPSSLKEVIIDTAVPSNNSTGDYVIFANATVVEGEYTLLYLYEFHVNANNQIYGYNVWVY